MKLFEIENAVDCRIIGRINRFTVEVEVYGRRERAHINNTGRLEELLFEGNWGKCVAKESGKLKYRLFAAACEGGYALIDTRFQMMAFERGIEHIPWIEGNLKRNPKVGDSVLDYLIDGSYVEVKSAALKKGRVAMYPDCPTERGRRHMLLLEELGKKRRAIAVFIAALPDVELFRPNMEADPILYKIMKGAKNIEFRAIQVEYVDGMVYLRNPDMRVEI